MCEVLLKNTELNCSYLSFGVVVVVVVGVPVLKHKHYPRLGFIVKRITLVCLSVY
jgi:hypothetical protein